MFAVKNGPGVPVFIGLTSFITKLYCMVWVEKWLSKITNKLLLGKIEKVIIQLESAQSLGQVSNVKKLTGFTNYFRVQIGNYRLGFELVDKSTIRLNIIADRKDIYKRFPKKH